MSGIRERTANRTLTALIVLEGIMALTGGRGGFILLWKLAVDAVFVI